MSSTAATTAASPPFATFAVPSASFAGAEYVEGLKERVQKNSPNLTSVESIVAVVRSQGNILLRLDLIDDVDKIEFRNDVYGVRRYLFDSHQWPTTTSSNDGDDDDDNKNSNTLLCGGDNELIGFPNYQGPTEVGRLMFVIRDAPWTDTIFCGAHAAFKVLQAGTPLMPTGSLPMFRDLDLGGEGHRMSEYLGVFPYIAMKLGLMGRTTAEESQILFLQKYVEGLSSKFYFDVCMNTEALGIPPEEGPFQNGAKNFIPTKKDESVLLTPERTEKLKSWIGDWLSKHEDLQRMDAYLAHRERKKFLVGDEVSFADVCFFLEMLRIYGRRIVREAVPDFRKRYPRAVRHFYMMLNEFPQLLTYLEDPNRHYKPAYGFLNQCEAVYSYGDVFHLPAEDEADKSSPPAEEAVAADGANSINSALAGIESAVALGTTLNVVTGNSERFSQIPWFLACLKLLGVKVVSSSAGEEGKKGGRSLDLDAVFDMLGEAGGVRFVLVFLANVEGALGASTKAKAKNMQIISMVIYLLNTYKNNDAAFFKKEVLDKTRSGAMYSNVSPGNAQYLEVLIEMNNQSEEGGVVCVAGADRMSLADVGVYTFVKIVLEDKELTACDEDAQRLKDQFPLLLTTYENVKRRWDL